MKEYTYSVARVRSKEVALLSGGEFEQLLAADSLASALRLLRDKGYGGDSQDNDELLSAAEKELWSFLKEVASGELLQFLQMPIDYHNLKAAIKAAFSGTKAHGAFLTGGTISWELLDHAVRNRAYSDLPTDFGKTAQAAVSLFLRTQDGQLCDIYVDQALLAAREQAAAQSKDAFLQQYATLDADLANLKIALRCAIQKKTPEFVEHAVYVGGTLSAQELARAAGNGLEPLYTYVENTAYAEGSAQMKQAAVFEKWCDDRLTAYLDAARYESFTAAPILAYAHAKQTELHAVRLVLSAKQNHLDENLIRERVRKLYV